MCDPPRKQKDDTVICYSATVYTGLNFVHWQKKTRMVHLQLMHWHTHTMVQHLPSSEPINLRQPAETTV